MVTKKIEQVKNFDTTSFFNNLEIQRYQNESQFDSVYSRNNLLKIVKDQTYLINFDEYDNIRTHQVAIYAKSYKINIF